MKNTDIVGPFDRRRFRTAQEKATLLVEVNAERGKVRLEVRRHNISGSLLYNWRSALKTAAVAMGAAEIGDYGIHSSGHYQSSGFARHVGGGARSTGTRARVGPSRGI